MASAMSDRFPLGMMVSMEVLDRDPYPLFQRLRELEPVTYAPAIDQWLVTSRDLGMEILRDAERFRTDSERSPIRRTFGPQMLSTEGEQQRRYKSACAPPFNARAVEELRPLVQGVVRNATDALPREGPIEVRRAWAAPIALATVARVIGLSPSNDGLLRDWYDTFADALMNYEGAPSVRTRADAAVVAFRHSVATALRAPNAGERSLLTELARAHPRLLDDEEIGSNALIVLFGGIETTEASIANALWAILVHEHVRLRAVVDEAVLARCVEESLRWEPAVQTGTRYAAVEATVGGTTIPAGALVQCMLGAMNRDPAHWQAPDTFDPWRAETTPHVAFGFGRHFCLGAALARLEARVALAHLFALMPRISLDRDRTTPPRGHEFRKPSELVVHPG